MRSKARRTGWSAALVAALGLATAALSRAEPVEFTNQILFPEEPHAWYRIPSLVISKSGTVLAFAERRIGTAHDYGHDSESVLRRSFDGGKTWGPMQTIISEKHLDPDSGPVVVDYQTGRIFRFFKWVSSAARSAEWDTEHPEEMKKMGYASYEIHSDDDGASWSLPRNIGLQHPEAKSRLSVGNGNHGIQLKDGRLVIQGGWMAEAKWVSAGKNMRGCFIVSDDHGETWRIAGWDQPTAQDWKDKPNTSPGGMQVEYNLLELNDGSIYVNARSSRNAVGVDADHPWRTILWSKDRGETMEGWRYQEGQVSGTHAGLTRYDRDRLLMTFATKPGRHEMSIMMSPDEGKTWPIAKVIDPGPGSYSDIAVTADKTILVLYEAGHPDRTVTSGTQPGGWADWLSVARFDKAWIEKK
jgi:sialidase-1